MPMKCPAPRAKSMTTDAMKGFDAIVSRPRDGQCQAQAWTKRLWPSRLPASKPPVVEPIRLEDGLPGLRVGEQLQACQLESALSHLLSAGSPYGAEHDPLALPLDGAGGALPFEI